MEHVHSLCLVEGNEDRGYAMLYDEISRYASRDYVVIYAVESDTTRAVRHMSQHGVEVETLVESGALTLVGRNEMYSVEKSELDSHKVLNSWHEMMLKVKRRSNFKGIVAIGSAETFLESSSHDKLVKYEEMIGKKFHIPLEAICCYTTKAVDRLSLGELVAILNAHHSTIHRECSYREWSPHRTIELVKRGINTALGKELAFLILKTMKLCYKVDEGQITSSPAVLEEMMGRIIGEKAAAHTLTYIKEEIKKSAAFGHA